MSPNKFLLIISFLLIQSQFLYSQDNQNKNCDVIFILIAHNSMVLDRIKINVLDSVRMVNGALKYKAYNCKGKLYYEVQTSKGIVYRGYFKGGKKVKVKPFLAYNEYGNEKYVDRKVVYSIKNGKWFRNDKNGKIIEIEIWKNDKLLKTIKKK